jgi:lysozyme
MNSYEYSSAGLALTKSFEGLRLTAYRDGAGILTIGYGHTGPDVHEGLVVTEADAEALLLRDMADAVACVNHCVTAEISQGKFDAMADFAYNAGRGAFRGSTLLRRVNAGDFAGAVKQFGLWVHAGGAVEPGLVRRRAAEAALFAS